MSEVSFSQCHCPECLSRRERRYGPAQYEPGIKSPHAIALEIERDMMRALKLAPNPTGDGASVREDSCTALTADDIRSAHLDTDAHNRIFPELKYAAALQVLRSIRDEQPTASAVVRGLCAAILERLK